MKAIPMPPIGERVQIDFPGLSASDDWSGRYVLSDIDGSDTITARPIIGSSPCLRAGTPVLVGYQIDGHRLHVGGIVINCGPSGAIIRLHTAEQRRFPRFCRPVAVSIEIPHTNLGVIEGLTEDISLGGLRAALPLPTPVDRRAFIAVGVAGSNPILAMGRILSCVARDHRSSHVVRAQFTLISASDQARLFALLDWPLVDTASAADSELRLERQDVSDLLAAGIVGAP
jgi:hypothetical protein